MSQATAQRAESSDVETARSRPVATFKQGGVEVSVWKNHTDKGRLTTPPSATATRTRRVNGRKRRVSARRIWRSCPSSPARHSRKS